MNRSGWELIGFIPGHGNSHSPKHYSYTDNPDKSRDHLYRLKQIDVNGDFDYSKCVRVSFPSERQQIRLYQNYPNPFSAGAGSASAGNPKTMIKYNIPANGRQYEEGSRHTPESGIRHQVSVSVKVYDITGREVATLVNKKHSPGEYKIEFDGSNLPSGIYFYTVETPRGSLSKKMLILK
jgi:hypothetical protein